MTTEGDDKCAHCGCPVLLFMGVSYPGLSSVVAGSRACVC